MSIPGAINFAKCICTGSGGVNNTDPGRDDGRGDSWARRHDGFWRITFEYEGKDPAIPEILHRSDVTFGWRRFVLVNVGWSGNGPRSLNTLGYYPVERRPVNQRGIPISPPDPTSWFSYDYLLPIATTPFQNPSQGRFAEVMLESIATKTSDFGGAMTDLEMELCRTKAQAGANYFYPGINLRGDGRIVAATANGFITGSREFRQTIYPLPSEALVIKSFPPPSNQLGIGYGASFRWTIRATYKEGGFSD